MKVAVIGQGYVGLPLAEAAAGAGHEVIGFDVDDKVISKIQIANKIRNFKVTSNSVEIRNCEVYIIAVPTPLTSENLPDLSFIISAAALIADSVDKGALVINESTSYPGTLREVILPEIQKKNGSKFLFASAPERIDPGNSNWNIKNTPRLVGGLTPEAAEVTCNFYSTFCDEVISLSSAEAAEAAKLLENTFRQVNIAFANEFAQIADKLGLSANEVINAAATKPFGFMRFTPGLGVGGHCIPVDPIYLAHKAEKLGATAKFIRQANEVNSLMPLFIVAKIINDFNGSIDGKKVCIVGLSYKSNISDLRESPSLILWQELQKYGAEITFHDEIVGTYDSHKSIALTENLFDIAIIAVHHQGLDVNKLKKSATYLFDCTGSIDGIKSL
jgi:UDP-N-acetyl-D-glucosamine dehydrogenase